MVDIGNELREAYGLDVVSLERVRHGSDDAASVWRAVAADGRAYAVKTGRDATGDRVCAHLAGVPGVPRPLSGPAGMSVTPWIDGTRALDGGMTERHWRALGTLLRRVHDAPPLDGLPREPHAHERQAAEVLDLDRGVRLEGWDSGAVRALVARADALAGEVGEAPYVLCHGDPWAGNVLLDGDGVWLVDWDDAVLAPRERDLMLLVSGVTDWAPASARGAVLDGYGTYEPDATRLAYYLCVRAMEDLTIATVALDATRPEAEREWAAAVVRGHFGAGGAVTRALSR